MGSIRILNTDSQKGQACVTHWRKWLNTGEYTGIEHCRMGQNQKGQG